MGTEERQSWVRVRVQSWPALEQVRSVLGHSVGSGDLHSLAPCCSPASRMGPLGSAPVILWVQIQAAHVRPAGLGAGVGSHLHPSPDSSPVLLPTTCSRSAQTHPFPGSPSAAGLVHLCAPAWSSPEQPGTPLQPLGAITGDLCQPWGGGMDWVARILRSSAVASIRRHLDWLLTTADRSVDRFSLLA